MKKFRLLLVTLLAIVGASSVGAWNASDLEGDYTWNYRETTSGYSTNLEALETTEFSTHIIITESETTEGGITISGMFDGSVEATIESDGDNEYIKIANGQHGGYNPGWECNYVIKGKSYNGTTWEDTDIYGLIRNDGSILFNCWIIKIISDGDYAGYLLGGRIVSGSTLTPAAPLLLVEVPAGVEIHPYSMSYQDSNDIPSTKPINVAVDGNDVYFQGMSRFLPEAWVKGTKSGNVVTFPANQYMGKNSTYDCYAFCNGETVFNYNAEAYTYTATGEIFGKENNIYDGYYKNPVLKAPEPYAVLDGNTLTFYYDPNKPTGAYDMNWGIGFPGWTNDGNGNNTITTVTFDASFDDYTELSNAYAFFKGLSALTTINHLEYLHTDNVTDMARMFHECSSLTSLDLSTFNTGNVTQMMEMFFRCSNLETIYCAEGTDWSTNSANKRDMFSGCSKLKGKCGNKTFSYNSSYQDGTYAKVYTGNDEVGGYFTSITEKREPYAVLSTNRKTLTFYYDNNKLTSGDNVFDVAWNQDGYPAWFGNTGNLTTVEFNESFDNYLDLTSTKRMFIGMPNLKTIINLKYLHTENVTDMSEMFYGCESLTSLELGDKFKTSNVTDMSYMFYDCESLTSLDLDKFNTSNVTNMKGMFWLCSSLTSLDLNNFNTSEVTNMSGMFYGCSGLKTIYCEEGTNWSNVSNTSNMFYYCISLSGRCGTKTFPFDSNYTDGAYAKVYKGGTEGGYFSEIPEPYAVLDGNTLTFYYDPNKPTGAYDMNWGIGFPGWTNDGNGNNTITTVTFDASFDDYTELSNAYAFFEGLSALTTINHLEYLHTDNVTDMAHMFYGCSSLTSLDLSTFNTGNVTQMMFMFNGCSNLETIYCAEGTDWSTNSANKQYMFSGCSKLKGKCGNKTFSYNSSYQDGTYAKVYTGNDEVGGYFTSIVETYEPYAVVSDEGATLSFYYDNRKSTYESDENVEVYNIPWKCDEERDVPGWTDYTNGNNKITTAVFDASFANYHGLTSTYNMFAGLFKLKNIENLNYLNTENVTNMKYMFWSCEKLITLDVSNFNVSNVTDMGQMFACCSRLKTIYCAPDANWSNEHYKSMFTGCDLLSGKCRGMEFKYSATYVHTEDGYYARVYTGDDEVGGYFTSIVERKGDANGDGVVDAVDFNMIANEILGYHQDNFDRVAADINGDNEIDAIDFNMIANKILYGSFSGEQGSKKNKGKTKETESEDSKEPM